MDSDLPPNEPDEVRHLRAERDFYKQLLHLDAVEAVEVLLEKALALICEVAGAKRGYIALGGEGGAGDAPRFWLARGFSQKDVETEVRKALSQTVIAEAIATGKTIAIASAMDDPRFAKKVSVKRNRIEALVCAPIGSGPPIGVVYLQDRVEKGAFTEEGRLKVELFARHLNPLADRLLARHEKNEATDPTLPYRQTLDMARIVGRSEALARVLKDVKLVAGREVSVLLTGPTGTGKTDLAQVIHDNSARKGRPFVALNCANLSETLAESELFGHERGAFTGADRRVTGQVAAASGGTLFLDEVGELPLSVQAKLLKFLDSKEYYAVGSTQASRADVRIISATNVNLEVATKERRFREDLYFRLRGISIRVPALAERIEDIRLLMQHFANRLSERENLPFLTFSPGARLAVEATEWPGNIRHLRSAVEEAVLRAHDEQVLVIQRHHLFPDSQRTGLGPKPPTPTLQKATKDFQARFVLEVLEETGWNNQAAAAILDITRSHVYNLINAFELKRKE